MNSHTKPAKPRPDFPLTAHPIGQWSKKLHGKVYYFGPWADPKSAEGKFNYQWPDIQAGRKPRPWPPVATPETTPEPDATSGPAVHNLVNGYLNECLNKTTTREMAQRTFKNYERTCKAFASAMNRNRLLSDLAADDFKGYRDRLAKGRGLVSLANELRAIRIMWNWGWTNIITTDHKVEATPLKLKEWLKMPSAKSLRMERADKPNRMMEADELRRVIGAAGIQFKAMILLGLNCGFGNTDIALLPESSVNLKSCWVEFPRPKTGVPRRCPLWPETVAAIQASIAKRPQPVTKDAQGNLFVTRHGQAYVRSVDGTQVDSVAAEFGKLLTGLGLKRPGLNFYSLRSVLETIGGDGGDQVAVDALMGHAPKANDMASVYRKRLNDDRRLAVVERVRAWLWPGGSEAAWKASEADRAKAQQAGEPTKPKRGRPRKASSKPVPDSNL